MEHVAKHMNGREFPLINKSFFFILGYFGEFCGGVGGYMTHKWVEEYLF